MLPAAPLAATSSAASSNVGPARAVTRAHSQRIADPPRPQRPDRMTQDRVHAAVPTDLTGEPGLDPWPLLLTLTDHDR
jgi:hypothetical protein